MPDELIDAPEPHSATNGEPDIDVSLDMRSFMGLSKEPPRLELPPMIDWVDFMAKKIEPPPEIAGGLFHAGSKVILGGGSKSYKTWTQVDMGLAVANGIPWMGFEMLQGRVLYINLEIQEYFMQRRTEILAKAKGVSPTSNRLTLWNLRGFSASYKAIIPEIIRTIEGEGFSLIMIDPIYKIYGGTNENDAGEVAQLLNSIELLSVKTGAAVVFGAHYSKGNQSAKESIDRVSGSGVLARDPDTLINFTKLEEQERRLSGRPLPGTLRPTNGKTKRQADPVSEPEPAPQVTPEAKPKGYDGPETG